MGTVKETKPIKTESRHQEPKRNSLWGLISHHAPVLSLDRWVVTSKKKKKKEKSENMGDKDNWGQRASWHINEAFEGKKKYS